jgi:hypothetical protein
MRTIPLAAITFAALSLIHYRSVRRAMVRGLQRQGRNQLRFLLFPAMPSCGLRAGRILPNQPLRSLWLRRLSLWVRKGTATALSA